MIASFGMIWKVAWAREDTDGWGYIKLGWGGGKVGQTALDTVSSSGGWQTVQPDGEKLSAIVPGDRTEEAPRYYAAGPILSNR